MHIVTLLFIIICLPWSLSWSLGVRSLSWSLGVRSLPLSWSLGVRSLSLSWSLGVRALLTSLNFIHHDGKFEIVTFCQLYSSHKVVQYNTSSKRIFYALQYLYRAILLKM